THEQEYKYIKGELAEKDAKVRTDLWRNWYQEFSGRYILLFIVGGIVAALALAGIIGLILRKTKSLWQPLVNWMGKGRRNTYNPTARAESIGEEIIEDLG